MIIIFFFIIVITEFPLPCVSYPFDYSVHGVCLTSYFLNILFRTPIITLSLSLLHFFGPTLFIPQEAQNGKKEKPYNQLKERKVVGATTQQGIKKQQGQGKQRTEKNMKGCSGGLLSALEELSLDWTRFGRTQPWMNMLWKNTALNEHALEEHSLEWTCSGRTQPWMNIPCSYVWDAPEAWWPSVTESCPCPCAECCWRWRQSPATDSACAASPGRCAGCRTSGRCQSNAPWR